MVVEKQKEEQKTNIIKREVALVRGKFHVEMLPASFPGECPEGAAIAVEKLCPILNIRFPNDTKPKIVMTDRGRGFFHTSNGKITNQYLQ